MEEGPRHHNNNPRATVLLRVCLCLSVYKRSRPHCDQQYIGGAVVGFFCSLFCYFNWPDQESSAPLCEGAARQKHREPSGELRCPHGLVLGGSAHFGDSPLPLRAKGESTRQHAQTPYNCARARLTRTTHTYTHTVGGALAAGRLSSGAAPAVCRRLGSSAHRLCVSDDYSRADGDSGEINLPPIP